VSPAKRRRRHTAAEYRRRKQRAAERGSTFYRERRVRGEERGYSRTQAAGHRRAGEPSPRRVSALRSSEFTIFTDRGERVDVRVNRAETRRAARYQVAVGRLERGEITPSEFRRRVSRWRPVAGHRLASDPDVALALKATTAPDEWVFDYRHGRTGRAS
jgi:hypothetical protein